MVSLQDSSFLSITKEIHGCQHSQHVLITRILIFIAHISWVWNIHIQLVGWVLRQSSGTPDYLFSHCYTIILHFHSRNYHLITPLIWELESSFHLLSQPLTIPLSSCLGSLISEMSPSQPCIQCPTSLAYDNYKTVAISCTILPASIQVTKELQNFNLKGIISYGFSNQMLWLLSDMKKCMFLLPLVWWVRNIQSVFTHLVIVSNIHL